MAHAQRNAGIDARLITGIPPAGSETPAERETRAGADFENNGQQHRTADFVPAQSLAFAVYCENSTDTNTCFSDTPRTTKPRASRAYCAASGVPQASRLPLEAASSVRPIDRRDDPSRTAASRSRRLHRGRVRLGRCALLAARRDCR